MVGDVKMIFKCLMHVMPATFIALILGAAGPAGAQNFLGGFHEAVLVVQDRSVWKVTMSEVGAWETVSEGPVDQAWLDIWGVAASAQHTLMRNPGTERGYIRLIEFEGIESDFIRPNDQPWDAGGIFDLNIRVWNMDAARMALMARGWASMSQPIEFTFGPFQVKEWIPRGPDSVRFAVSERVAPPLEGYPLMKRMSRSFNSTMVVSDMAEARRFWEDTLGFKTYLEHKAPSKEPGPNVLGIPHNLATEIVREVYILHPDGINEGSIELLSYDGATGSDFSGRTSMPNRGIARLRFPVEGLSALLERVENAGFPVHTQGQDVPLSGVGVVDVAVVEAPGGTMVELYEIKE